MVLLATIFYFYYTVFLYAFDTVFPEISRGSFSELLAALTNGSLGPELQPILVLTIATLDMLFVYIVGSLVTRTTAYMILNLTAYEVWKRPGHVLRRFRKARGQWWYFHGWGQICDWVGPWKTLSFAYGFKMSVC